MSRQERECPLVHTEDTVGSLNDSAGPQAGRESNLAAQGWAGTVPGPSIRRLIWWWGGRWLGELGLWEQKETEELLARPFVALLIFPGGNINFRSCAPIPTYTAFRP